MNKRDFGLTILAVSILIGLWTQPSLAQRQGRSRAKIRDTSNSKLPPVKNIAGPKVGKNGKMGTVTPTTSTPIPTPITIPQVPATPTPTPKKPSWFDGKWGLTGKITVNGTRTVTGSDPRLPTGTCTGTISRTYTSKIILEDTFEPPPVALNQAQMAKMGIPVPKAVAENTGKNQLKWMVSQLRALENREVEVTIADKVVCSWKNPTPSQRTQTFSFKGVINDLNIGMVTLDKTNQMIEIELGFGADSRKLLEYKVEQTGEKTQFEMEMVSPYPQVRGFTVFTKITAPPTFLMDPSKGFDYTSPIVHEKSGLLTADAESDWEPDIIVKYKFEKLY